LESTNRLDYFKEEISTQCPELPLTAHSKFYLEEGTEITDDTLILLRNDDIIYLESHGNPFDNGNLLAQYEVIEKIGQGGFGNVHKAKHRDNGKIVAIKYIDITECSI
jgi:serine/threonine protein kinase